MLVCIGCRSVWLSLEIDKVVKERLRRGCGVVKGVCDIDDWVGKRNVMQA